MSSWSTSRLYLELTRLWNRWFPRILIKPGQSSLQLSSFQNGDWLEIDEVAESRNPLAQVTFLVPDSACFFKLRRFPVESVSAQALREAVELDLDRWSPWQDEFDFYFWPRRSGDYWQVAVWVWQSSYLLAARENLAVSPTHVMPERAWKLASQDTGVPSYVHVDTAGAGVWIYSEVSPEFASLRITEVVNEADAQRFKAALADRSVPILFDPEVDLSELSWEQPGDSLGIRYSVPNSSALSFARQPGVSDLADPSFWIKPVGALVGLYMLWLAGSGLVLLKHGSEVQEYSNQLSSVSNEVLDARAEVERINARLESVQRMRASQMTLESALASLSVTLPKNAWLEHIEYRGDDGGWLEITGESLQSTSLAAVLEQMPEVEQAMFLTDIRRDKRTGLEPFKLRLKLVETP